LESDSPNDRAIQDSASAGGGRVSALFPTGSGTQFSLPFLDGSIRISGTQTDGEFSLLEMHVHPDMGPDPHIHLNEVELFYVLSGSYTIVVGDESIEATPGSIALVPKGVPHGLTAGPEGGRHLTVFSPAGPEGFFPEADRLSHSSEPMQMGELFSAFGMVLLRDK